MKVFYKNPWLNIYTLCILVAFAIYFSYDLELYTPFEKYSIPIQRVSFTIGLIAVVLLTRTILIKFIDRMEQGHGDQYNLKRIVRLISGTVILFIIISVLFRRPYSTIAGLGLISLVLGFALQAPITSFIAWLYIIFRRPYQVGDRVQIGEDKGDIVEISYLDTILREVRGDYIGNDRESGRLIYFPNSLILTGKVINYSGQFTPFIWDETAIQIAYTSDLGFVENCLIDATTADFKKRFPNKKMAGNEPSIYFRINTYAWLEAVVSYPVEPSDTTGRRNRILQRALPLLNAQPEKVQFPEGTRR